MTPMIDVVFLLLVFFLWTSSFNEPEFDLPSALAMQAETAAQSRGSSESTPELFDEIVIEVDGADALSLNGQAVASLEQLSAQLREIVQLGASPQVIIDPTEATAVGRAIAVYDTARAAGLDRVLFAAKG